MQKRVIVAISKFVTATSSVWLFSCFHAAYGRILVPVLYSPPSFFVALDSSNNSKQPNPQLTNQLPPLPSIPSASGHESSRAQLRPILYLPRVQPIEKSILRLVFPQTKVSFPLQHAHIVLCAGHFVVGQSILHSVAPSFVSNRQLLGLWPHRIPEHRIQALKGAAVAAAVSGLATNKLLPP